MPSQLTHRGYLGSVETSLDDECLHGKLQFVDDIITYEGETVSELKIAFKDAVDRYLEHCKTIGKSPDKPCSGTFNVRCGADRHRRAVVAAAAQGTTLNEFVNRAIDHSLNPVDAASAPEYKRSVEVSTTDVGVKWGINGQH